MMGDQEGSPVQGPFRWKLRVTPFRARMRLEVEVESWTSKFSAIVLDEECGVPSRTENAEDT